MPEWNGMAEVFVAAVRTMVKEEVQSALRVHVSHEPVPAKGRWMTPPQAARHVGVPTRTIYRMIHSEEISFRLKNVDENPRQRKFLVNVDEVAAAVERRARGAAKASFGESLEATAARIRSSGSKG